MNYVAKMTWKSFTKLCKCELGFGMKLYYLKPATNKITVDLLEF